MTERPGANPFLAGVTGHCPNCGEGPLFTGFLKLAPSCSKCGFDLAKADSGDGPAVFVIFIAGFGWLAYGIGLGADKAWLVGVVPFIAASVVKNALGAALMPAVRRIVDRRV